MVRPAIMNAREKRPPQDANSLCPLRDGCCLSVDRQEPIAAPVRGLLLAGCPTAVGRLVVSVVVDAVDRVTPARSFSHVGQEVFERSSPSLADFDASPAVPAISDASFVLAPCDHRRPNAILVSHRVASAMAMACIASIAVGSVLSIKAAARLGSSASEALPLGSVLFAAVTSAEPASLSFWRILRSPNNHKTPETPARQINEFAHQILPHAEPHRNNRRQASCEFDAVRPLSLAC